MFDYSTFVIVLSRQYAQRSRVRKLQYIAELERNVQALQARVCANRSFKHLFTFEIDLEVTDRYMPQYGSIKCVSYITGRRV